MGDAWLDVVESRFAFSSNNLQNGNSQNNYSNETPTIAVHCIAGLGRAPVLVAIALMEYCKCDAVFAVTLIRKSRRGAINRKQLTYLEQYKCRRRNRRANASDACCLIS